VIEGDRPIEAIHREITAVVEQKLRLSGLLPLEPATGVR